METILYEGTLKEVNEKIARLAEVYKVKVIQFTTISLKMCAGNSPLMHTVLLELRDK